MILALTIGCSSSKKQKYTEEQLQLIPQPQTTNLPKASGGLVLAVSGHTVTADEIVLPLLDYFQKYSQKSDLAQFRHEAQRAVEQSIVSKVAGILIYEQAKKNAGDDIDEALEKAVESEVRRFIISFEGNYAKAEQALKQMGYDWDSFREYQRKMILSQSYISSELPEQKSVTYSELIEYYNKMKEDFSTQAKIEFQLIDIQHDKLEVSEPNVTQFEKAKKIAKILVRRLDAGRDFAELAKDYSHGHRKAFGGLWKPTNPDSLAYPYNVLAEHAKKIEPGQIAGPIESGNHIFIMKLIDKQDQNVEPFENVQKEIEAKINFERRKTGIDKFNAKLVRQAVIANKNKFVIFCIQRLQQMCNI